MNGPSTHILNLLLAWPDNMMTAREIFENLPAGAVRNINDVRMALHYLKTSKQVFAVDDVDAEGNPTKNYMIARATNAAGNA